MLSKRVKSIVSEWARRFSTSNKFDVIGLGNNLRKVRKNNLQKEKRRVFRSIGKGNKDH